MRKQILSSLAIFTVGLSLSAGNLVLNSQFSPKDNPAVRVPPNWTIRKSNYQPVKYIKENLPEGATSAIEVDISSALPGHGAISQNVIVKKGSGYKLTAMIKSSVPGVGYIAIKLRGNGQRIKAKGLKTALSTTEWKKVTIHIPADYNATTIRILCRYKQELSNVGQKVWFTNVQLEEITTP